MELKTLALVALCACVPQSKRLILTDDMRRPAMGPSLADSVRSDRFGGESQTEDIDPFAAADPLAMPKTAPQPATPRAAPVSAMSPPIGKKPASPAPLRQPSASPTPPEQRYVLRLVEHGRVWEVELPEDTGGYEVRIPLGSSPEQPTLADQELLGKEQKPGPAKSYLSTLARVEEMYSSHRYEMALIELVDLEQQYPKEARIAAMKGSIYQKLGKAQLAREAWKKALELDPSDTAVAEALGSMKEE